MTDDAISIIGRPITHLASSREDRSSWWMAVYPFTAVAGAVKDGDGIAAAFWGTVILGLLGIWQWGQAAEDRTLTHKLIMSAVGAVAIALVIFPLTHSPTWRAVGVALAPIPFVIDILGAVRTRWRRTQT